ncbi:hypothetical protein HYQ44_011269 [Verticillium longisporum]|nr:hypothetical protein HYQ44_011269 [Verticillium longisporum]
MAALAGGLDKDAPFSVNNLVVSNWQDNQVSLGFLDRWSSRAREALLQEQWTVLSPVFEVASPDIPHYVFTPHHILPITESGPVFPGHAYGDPKAIQVLSTSTTVNRIRLHPSHDRLRHGSSKNEKPGDKELQMGARTYRSPEADMPHSDITSAVDIWSLGCMFLEFATWQLLGWDAVEEDFSQARLEAEPGGGIIVDAFFIRHRDGRIEVKPAVRRWVDDLMGRGSCSPFLEELLRLAMINMLCVEAAERDSAEEIAVKLKVMSDRCQIERNFCQPRPS